MGWTEANYAQPKMWPAAPYVTNRFQNGTLDTLVTAGYSATPALNKKLGMVGKLRVEGGTAAGAKTFTKIGFLPGAITASTATLKVSIQGASNAGFYPDGTIKGAGNAGFNTVALSALTASTFAVLTLGAPVTLTHGDPVSAVFELASAGVGASVAISGQSMTSPALAACSNYDGAVWTSLATGIPNVVFITASGECCSLIMTCGPHSVTTSSAFASATATNSRGIVFDVPFDMEFVGCQIGMTVNASTSDFTVSLRDSAGALIESITYLAASQIARLNTSIIVAPTTFTPKVMRRGERYIITVDAGGATNVTLTSVTTTAQTSGDMAPLHPGGDAIGSATITSNVLDALDWASRPMMQILYSREFIPGLGVSGKITNSDTMVVK